MNQNILKTVFLSTLIVVATVVSLYVFYESSLIFLSALIGVALASLLNPVITFIEKRSGISRFIAALSILFGIAVIFIVLFYLVGAIIFEQVFSLKETLPEIVAKWEERWEMLGEEYPRVAEALSKAQPMGLAQTTVSYIGVGLSSLAGAFTGLTLAAVIALFTVVNSKKYYKGFVGFFPEKTCERVSRYLTLAGDVLRKWFFAQFIDMCAVAVLTTLGLWIAGIKYWALFGFLAGVFSVVPYVGIIVVVILSGFVVAVLQPEKILWLLAVFAITQQLEGNFILPKVMKDNVHTPAALLIFLMILTGSWFGVLGVFVTPPLLAIGVAIYKDRQSST